MKWSKDKILKYCLIVFLMINPIFDTVLLYNHVTTAFRVGFLFLYVVIIFFMYKESHRDFKRLFIFYALVLAYLCISIGHSKGFTTLIEGSLSYNAILEAMTLLKLCVPFTILFILKYVGIDKKDFKNIILAWIIIISGSIVVTNLVGYSLSSYTGEITRNSIFSWGKDLSVNVTATKGFFSYANQEAIVTMLLLCSCFYETVTSKKKKNVLWSVLLLVISLSMWMLGTRLATYGGLLVLFGLICLYVINSFITKKYSYFELIGPICVFLLGIVLLPIMPANNRLSEIENVKNGVSESTSNEEGVCEIEQGTCNGKVEEDVPVSTDEDLEYIENYINKATIGKQFYMDYYPYIYDMTFWRSVVEYQKDHYVDYRNMEMMIAKRLWEVDDRWTDVLFGISNVRMQQVTNIERDFYLQYFSFGIVGSTICLSYYLVVMVFLMKKTIKEMCLWNMVSLSILELFLVGSFITGNSLNFLATIIPMAFIVGFSVQYKHCEKKTSIV